MDSNSGILSENTQANYTERYDSLLKMKNHVIKYSDECPCVDEVDCRLNILF